MEVQLFSPHGARLFFSRYGFSLSLLTGLQETLEKGPRFPVLCLMGYGLFPPPSNSVRATGPILDLKTGQNCSGNTSFVLTQPPQGNWCSFFGRRQDRSFFHSPHGGRHAIRRPAPTFRPGRDWRTPFFFSLIMLRLVLRRHSSNPDPPPTMVSSGSDPRLYSPFCVVEDSPNDFLWFSPSSKAGPGLLQKIVDRAARPVRRFSFFRGRMAGRAVVFPPPFFRKRSEERFLSPLLLIY